MFDVEKYLARNTTDDEMDFQESDFDSSNHELIERVNHDGILNNVHYNITSGTVIETNDKNVIRIKFLSDDDSD